MRHGLLRRAGKILACSLALGGCAGVPVPPDWSAAQPVVQSTPGAAGVRDVRGLYRAALCARLRADDPPCAAVLQRLAGEPAAPPRAPRDGSDGRYRIAFVPGIFSECFEFLLRPFADVERDLRGRGYTVDYLGTPGRGTSRQNGAALARLIDGLAGDDRPVIVFAHSKGVPDVLDLVAEHPAARARIAAVVSIAGAVNGTYLADSLQTVYRDWIADLPLPGCKAGSGGEIDDLRRDVRLHWWAAHRAAVTVPVFSLVAAPDPDRISPAILTTYRALAKIDPRNDGKLVWYDQIVPGGYLLGYVNADHWAIANPLAAELPALAFMFRDGVPRTALVEAAIDAVVATLEGNAMPR